MIYLATGGIIKTFDGKKETFQDMRIVQADDEEDAFCSYYGYWNTVDDPDVEYEVDHVSMARMIVSSEIPKKK